MKFKTFQRYVFKIHTTRLKRCKWNLNLTVDEARKNEELVALMDNQVFRWIDEIYNKGNLNDKYYGLKSCIKKMKKMKVNQDNKKRINLCYQELDKIQFYPDYVCIVADTKSDFDRACSKKGFKINGQNFKRLVGTSGGIKKSTVVFISEKLYPLLSSRLDNDRNEFQKLVPAKVEAYKALSCSGSVSVCDANEFSDLNVIVVPDCFTRFKEDVIYLDDDKCEEPEMKLLHNYEIEKNCSDGFGLISKELSDKWVQRVDRFQNETGGMCLRCAFLKGMVFTFPFKEFADKIAKSYWVTDIWGDAQDIRKADLILTESMLKLWNAYGSYEDYRKACLRNHYTFAVTKLCPTKLENEREFNYQFLQTYQLDESQFNDLLSPTIEFYKDVLSSDYRKAILFLKGENLNKKSIPLLDNDFSKAMMIDKNVFKDKYVHDRIYQMIKKKINGAKIGRIKVHANYSIISGDPYSLCQSMFGLPVTGILQKGEMYNSYWNKYGSKSVVCFRAPMSCHNNIRKLSIARNKLVEHWYRYMNCVTILNSWDTTTDATNGADYDSDAYFVTDNSILIDNLKELPTVVCAQRKAEKTIVTEKNLQESNKNGFGNPVGKITNRVTSQICLQSRFDKESKQYKTLDYRIICGQLYQQNAIDSIKGVQTKDMPKDWYSIKDTLSDKKQKQKHNNFYSSICAHKKPYFMIYIYPTDMMKYREYIKNVNLSIMRKFGMTLDELLIVKDKTEDEAREIEYFYKFMPVFPDNCLMNRICYKIENEFRDINTKDKFSDFDYSIYKSNTQYSINTYNNIYKIFKEYVAEKKSFRKRTAHKKIDTDTEICNLELMKSQFKKSCESCCSNEYELCNVLLDICYGKDSNQSLVWNVCGKTIIENLLSKNNGRLFYPELDNKGDIIFNGRRFKMQEYIKEE